MVMESTTADDLTLNAEDDDEEEDHVRLAFLREPDELRHHRCFPDKAGGAPAWLDPVHLPDGEARLCGFCAEPLRFALQAYAPLPPAEGEDEDAAYHRALFVFMCPAMACLRLDLREQLLGRRRSVRVFRCQLPRDNAFYGFYTGEDDATPCAGVEAAAAPLCAWCRTWRAERACAGCATTASLFCSEKHLELHLRSCHGNDHDAPSASAWPEYVMYTDDEETLARDAESSSPSTAAEQEQSEEDDAAADDEAAALDEWMDAFEADEDNARWAAFQAVVSAEQDQVLRYGGARPLWAVASGALPGGGAPACPRCGGARRFELQPMPQLLHFFHVEVRNPDPLDWATVVVYTCARSCAGGGGGGYVEEFAWVQRLPWRPSDARSGEDRSGGWRAHGFL